MARTPKAKNVDALAGMIRRARSDPAEKVEVVDTDKEWRPSLTPAQSQLYDCDVRRILAHAEKASGKTIGCLNKLVKHCYENDNACAVVFVRVRAQAGEGGAWEKLSKQVLPEWSQGDYHVEYSEVKYDRQHNEYRMLTNRYGGESKMVLVSCPAASQLEERWPGIEPSFVFADELTTCDDIAYFRSIDQQIGRRPFVQGVQQYVAACNPAGPSHWVYKLFFEDCFDEETGVHDPSFTTIYFPITENAKNLQPGYIEGLKSTYRGDPTMALRMIAGEWVDHPTGEALFGELYSAASHIRPLTKEAMPDFGKGLLPSETHPFVIGIDPAGGVNNAWIFMNWIPMEGRMKWIPFDEIVTIKKKIKWDDFVPIVMRRIVWWREQIKAKPPLVLISDNNAFNQYRATTGSYDILTIEDIWEKRRAEYGLEAIKVKQAPKFQGSVRARVSILQSALAANEIVISARCTKLQAMLTQLESEKQSKTAAFDPERAMTPRRCAHLHPFDALTYPMLCASVAPTMLQPTRTEGGQTLISVGSQ